MHVGRAHRAPTDVALHERLPCGACGRGERRPGDPRSAEIGHDLIPLNQRARCGTGASLMQPCDALEVRRRDRIGLGDDRGRRGNRRESRRTGPAAPAALGSTSGAARRHVSDLTSRKAPRAQPGPRARGSDLGQRNFAQDGRKLCSLRLQARSARRGTLAVHRRTRARAPRRSTASATLSGSEPSRRSRGDPGPALRGSGGVWGGRAGGRGLGEGRGGCGWVLMAGLGSVRSWDGLVDGHDRARAASTRRGLLAPLAALGLPYPLCPGCGGGCRWEGGGQSEVP